MKESIRNRLPGTVKSIVSDKVLTEVLVETEIGEIAAIITTAVSGRDETQSRK
jgi:molybdopterin-binding protein